MGVSEIDAIDNMCIKIVSRTKLCSNSSGSNSVREVTELKVTELRKTLPLQLKVKIR